MRSIAQDGVKMLTQAYWDRHRALIATAQRRCEAASLCSFSPQIGQCYDGSLLVVGRCTNGWEPLDSGGGGEPSPAFSMNDVERFWRTPRPGEGYRFGRSAFWQVARRVANELAGAQPDAPGWAERIAWTYKLAPNGSDIPGVVATTGFKLRTFQLDAARCLLGIELAELRPANVLVLAGWEGWAADFSDTLGGESLECAEANGWIDRWTRIGRKGPSVVITKHPQGKPDRRSVVSAVVQRMRAHGAPDVVR
ncbi:MAG: hypothetical protein HY856_00655 [Burkholderiales bacterium]|nr:hypothetical protein [Burkholderiales bacterium]